MLPSLAHCWGCQGREVGSGGNKFRDHGKVERSTLYCCFIYLTIKLARGGAVTLFQRNLFTAQSLLKPELVAGRLPGWLGISLSALLTPAPPRPLRIRGGLCTSGPLWLWKAFSLFSRGWPGAAAVLSLSVEMSGPLLWVHPLNKVHELRLAHCRLCCRDHVFNVMIYICAASPESPKRQWMLNN